MPDVFTDLFDLAHAFVRDSADRILRWGPGARQLYGWDEAEALGRVSHELLRTRLPESLEEIREKLFHDGEWRGELIRTTKEGFQVTVVSRWVLRRDASGKSSAVLEIDNDITERRQAEAGRERLLRESDKLLEIYRALSRSLEQSEVTSTICRAVRELVGADGAAFIISEGEEVFYADEDSIGPLWKGSRFPAISCVSGWAITERQPAIIGDVYDDARVPIELYRPTFVRSLLMVPVRALRPVGAVGAYWAEKREIGEGELRLMQALAHAADLAFTNSQLYEQTKHARLEAESANRLKDEFLATLSHELRTPLTAITGWTHMLANGNLDPTTTQHAISVIKRNTEQQKKIVEDVLDASRIITGKLHIEMEQAQLIPIIEAACDAVRPAARAKGVELRCDYDPHIGLVTCDPARLQQVVWNLLANAVKFTTAGGQVRVKVARLLMHLRIEVSDTGQGIAPDFLPYVFDRFRQADSSITRQHGGLGLGLSIVRHLVEAHGGSVHAYSAGEGLGATFTIDMPPTPGEVSPIADGNLEEAQTRSAHPGAEIYEEGAPPPLVGLRVLLVDDDEDTLEMLAAFLRQSGAEVATALSADDALKELRRQTPDVIVSDIAMPGGDGYDLMQRVRRLGDGRGGHIPSLALTAYAGDSNRALALSAGYQRHLTKPVAPRRLQEAIADLVGKAKSY